MRTDNGILLGLARRLDLWAFGGMEWNGYGDGTNCLEQKPNMNTAIKALVFSDFIHHAPTDLPSSRPRARSLPTYRASSHSSTHSLPPHLLLPPSPHPLLILPPLPLNIPETPPPLALATLLPKPSIQPQKRIRIPLTQHRLALARVLALWFPSLARYLARPFCCLDGSQRLRCDDDAGGEEEDREEQLEGYVGGEGGVRKGGSVFVGGVDAEIEG